MELGKSLRKNPKELSRITGVLTLGESFLININDLKISEVIEVEKSHLEYQGITYNFVKFNYPLIIPDVNFFELKHSGIEYFVGDFLKMNVFEYPPQNGVVLICKNGCYGFKYI